MRKSENNFNWTAWGDTDPGRQRENNEDRIHCDEERGIFVVVDGMGGEAAGEEAAQRALACIRQRLEHKTGTVARRIREAITAANNEVYRLAGERPEWRGMACVLTAAVIEDGHVHIGHVGDTRLYTIRDGEIRKVTPDHSPVGEREEAGELHELEAMRHPRRNEVYRDVGSRPHKPEDDDFIDYIQIPFEPDSALLLCSDGLTDMITSTDILRALQRNAGNPRASVRQLIDMANAAGGKDNISIIVAEGKSFERVHDEESAVGPLDPALAGSLPGIAAFEDRPRSFFRAFTGRWPVFLYGLSLGIILLSFLSTRVPIEGPVAGGAPPDKLLNRGLLVVEPGSAEFPTIRSALEKAQPGDRIEVGRGEYNEQIQLKENVTLIARNPGEAVIQILQPLAESEAAVSAEGLKRGAIAGFVIRPGPGVTLPVGIGILNSDIDVSDVEVSGTTRAGIWFDGQSRATLSASYIHSNLGSGIVAGGSSAPRLRSNVIVRNGAARGQAYPGIQILDQASPEIVRNVISENGAEGIRIPRPEMRNRMKDNFFAAGGKGNKAGAVAAPRP